ncbi:MAG: restriction endonuclease [Pseudomonadota bacterium]
MTIPDYESLMLPLLELVRDGSDVHMKEAIERLGRQLGLSAEELRTMLPSGVSTTFGSRLSWAKTYLKQAGLLEQPRRGVVRLTSRGAAVLGQSPSRVDNQLLQRFPEFLEFRSRTKSVKQEPLEPMSAEADRVAASPKPPHEQVDDAMKEINATLASDLVATIKDCTPVFFEELVVKLLLRMGYGGSRQEAGRAVGRSGDGGIDGIINEDRLGLDAIYIQAKRWEGTVGRPEIMKFVGALAGQRANKGVFISTSTYTQEARDYAAQSQYKVVLIDGERLAQLMIEYNLGVSVAAVYEVKRIDNDFFVDE